MNLNALIGQRVDKLERSRSADRKHCWRAMPPLGSEPRLRKLSGHHALRRQRAALELYVRGTPEKVA